MDGKGNIVPVPELVPPDTLARVELDSSLPVQGPTIIGEWLMVDMRLAKKVVPGTRLYRVCQDLSERGACGVVESTFVINVLEATSDDRRFLLASSNWPR